MKSFSSTDYNRNYKFSRFNSSSIFENKRIVYNSLSNKGFFFALDDEKSLPLLLKRNKKYLIKHKFITKKETDDLLLARKKLKNHITDSELILTILPTMNCQFRCIYCYEEKDNLVLSSSLIESIICLIEENAKRNHNIRILWFGGEPLLEFEIIKKINSSAQSICKKHNVSFKSSITTNGYTLLPNVFEELVCLGISDFQITIDGNKQTHDNSRVLKSGKGTYDKIINNLIMIKSLKKINYNIFIRINITKKTLNYLKEILTNLDNIFGLDSRFKVLLKLVGNYGGVGVNKIADDLIVDKNIQSYFSKLAKAYNIKIITNSIISDSINLCYASYKNSYTILPNGNIKKCTIELNSKYNSLGDLKSAGHFNLNKSRLLLWNNLSKKTYTSNKCKRCMFFANCFGIICPIHCFSFSKGCNLDMNYDQELQLLFKNSSEIFKELKL